MGRRFEPDPWYHFFLRKASDYAGYRGFVAEVTLDLYCGEGAVFERFWGVVKGVGV